MTDREDTRHQQAAVDQARENLAVALEQLSTEAKTTAKTARTKRGNPDLPSVYAATRAVEHAEEALDIALMDLHAAQGGDI